MLLRYYITYYTRRAGDAETTIQRAALGPKKQKTKKNTPPQGKGTQTHNDGGPTLHEEETGVGCGDGGQMKRIGACGMVSFLVGSRLLFVLSLCPLCPLCPPCLSSVTLPHCAVERYLK